MIIKCCHKLCIELDYFLKNWFINHKILKVESFLGLLESRDAKNICLTCFIFECLYLHPKHCFECAKPQYERSIRPNSLVWHMKGAPLNGITLGHTISDPINRMITLTGRFYLNGTFLIWSQKATDTINHNPIKRHPL